MVDTSSHTTPAFPVEIGSFIMNEPSGPYPDEEYENYGLGQPNPTRISWTKSYDVATHKIPNPAWKTMQTSRQTLWNLDIDFTILETIKLQNIKQLVDKNNPVYVRTAFASMWMYIQSFTANAEAGFSDARWTCTMKLIQVND